MASKKKNIAVAVLDMTGSMTGQEERVVSSMNEYVSALPKTCDMTVFLFNSNTWDTMYSGKVSKWTPMERSRYKPNFTTPLYDSIAKAIQYAEAKASEGDKVMIMIDTDGFENASTDYDRMNGGAEKIKALVKECEDKGWAFKFMANGLDEQAAMQVGMIGRSLGMNTVQTTYANRTATYASAGRTTAEYFAGASGSTGSAGGYADSSTAGDVPWLTTNVSAPPKPTTDKPKAKPKSKK